MVRSGLGSKWSCLFANDIDPKKGASYIENWGEKELRVGDVADIDTADLPGRADLAWASFPCQDLSLAGSGAGLRGERSGTFWSFWRLMKTLAVEGRAVPLIVIENVCGTLTSNGGRDFTALITALTRQDYSCGALVIDAVHFIPQSRPRLFIIAVHSSQAIDEHLFSAQADEKWCTPALHRAYARLSLQDKKRWIWWQLKSPPLRTDGFSDLEESPPQGVRWHTAKETRRLLSMMNESHFAKVVEAKRAGKRVIGTVYKRTRPTKEGGYKQRAEIRFDNIAGCLRTPTGGSSRQTLMIVEGENVKSRLLSPREAARLMGISDDYALPRRYNEAYHLAGDGVVVPVVRHIAENIFEPVLNAEIFTQEKVA